MAKAIRWRSELAAEIAVHREIGMRPVQVDPQLVGLEFDLGFFLAEEPRMRDYAKTLLKEARATMPYAQETAIGYRPARVRAAGRPRLQAADVDALDTLADRWGGALWLESLLATVWTVRTYLRLHAERHGKVESPHVQGFGHWHKEAVEEMQHTLWGNRRPEPRLVRAWRRHA
jgi:hypothetical protein